ncbi:MAG: hypothetical protein LUD22_03305, partial [Coprobacillus sp.]|nr:hypothetical protein [Coprobacillus sp.]
MKRKLFKKLVLGVLMLGLPISSLTSCGFLSTSSNTTVNTITDIETGLDANGNIVLTITFSNMDPVIVTIPAGTTGSDGVGIESIYYSPSSDGTSTIVTIVYTDPDRDPDVISIPNGSTLTSTNTVTDQETGLSYIVFTFQVGSEEYTVTFEIPKGDQGDKGVGIADITYNYDTDDEGNPGVTMVIELDNGESAYVFIPTGSQGEEGVGIESIVASTVGDEYIVTITYTNGESESVSFTKPADGNSWYTGNGIGNVPDGTRDGDFYFDTQSMTIYLKRDGNWVVVCTFTTDQTQHTVSFDLNDKDSDVNASMPEGWTYPYQATIYHNSYFQTETNKPSDYAYTWGIPIPTREGYTFTGWCTSA